MTSDPKFLSTERKITPKFFNEDTNKIQEQSFQSTLIPLPMRTPIDSEESL